MTDTATSPGWIDAVRAVNSGPELLGFLKRRLTQPYEEGPPPNDRQGEGPGRVFEDLAREDRTFKLRLEETIAGYFKSDEATPGDASSLLLLEGLFDLAQHLALSGAFTTLQAWLERHKAALEADPEAVLGRAVLGALAASQGPGLKEHRDFWLHLWHTSPLPWRPRAFIGLRMQDLATAASELPQLVQYASDAEQDPGPLLKGMWLQLGGREAICEWLRKSASHPVASAIRSALHRKLPEAEWDAIPPGPRKRALRSLSSGGALANAAQS